MIKSKTTFVTILIALMLAIIDAGLFKLCMPAFVILTGALALYGYFRGAAISAAGSAARTPNSRGSSWLSLCDW